jgi:hypothetical protein
MALYIKTEEYAEYGISRDSDLDRVRAVVQMDLKMDRVFVGFVNEREYVRVDFLYLRTPRRPKRRGQYSGHSRRQQQA